MLLVWVGTFALTVSPELHRLLHKDAQAPEHNCLITQIQQQPLLAGFSSAAAPAVAPVVAAAVCTPEVQFLPARDYRVSPSRAPPALLSSATVAG
jgi:hypothetical protein